MDLEQLVREGRFREDLYYRINTVHIALPPLRDRREDIIPLAERFALSFAGKYHRPVTGIDANAAAMLRSARWNGNIRELQNAVEKAVILSEGALLTLSDFGSESSGFAAATTLRTVNEAEEERMIRETMERVEGNISAASKALGV